MIILFTVDTRALCQLQEVAELLQIRQNGDTFTSLQLTMLLHLLRQYNDMPEISDPKQHTEVHQGEYEMLTKKHNMGHYFLLLL